MATVGEEGAFEAMWDGVVDENWAKQNHSVWYAREVEKGNVPRSPPTASFSRAQTVDGRHVAIRARMSGRVAKGQGSGQSRKLGRAIAPAWRCRTCAEPSACRH